MTVAPSADVAARRRARMRLAPAILAALAPAVAGAADVRPPELLARPLERRMHSCYPVESRIAHEEATVVATVNVDREGRVTSVTVPAGTPERLQRATECVAGEMRFSPARVDGRPAPAEVKVPFDFSLSYRGEDQPPEMFTPTLRSSRRSVDQALRECYPADFTGAGEVLLAAVVKADGRAHEISIAGSSGRSEVDEIALCVMEKLRFRPARRGSEKIDADVTWSIRVMPPD
jgi:TonB family protein